MYNFTNKYRYIGIFQKPETNTSSNET